MDFKLKLKKLGAFLMLLEILQWVAFNEVNFVTF